MLNRLARAGITKLFTPVAKLFVRLGISPDAVTLVGTIGVMIGALAFYPRGELFWGTVVITAFVFSDAIDGIMARLLDRPSKWGAFLDSTLDRFADAAIFAGLVLWGYGVGEEPLIGHFALAILILGSIVPYARARAEGLGMNAAVGIAERADRLVVALVLTGFTGLGLPTIVLTITLGLLTLAAFITVLQRIIVVRKQALEQV
ncbi:MAG TPA: CDP-alcohol phosphatidyltransferase family protein [Actinomycetales bacterium]|nr:CDP-alcohol phosphatidyltransferase family protein [Actinomycetales bacterium]